MNKWPIAAVILAVALVSGGVTAGVILGDPGGPPDPYLNPPPQRTPVWSPGPPVPRDPCDDPKYQAACEELWGLITPAPEPSPYVPSRTDIPPIPFETGLRDDCPAGWESTGQPGVFSICYPADEWDVATIDPQPNIVQPGDTQAKDPESWWSFLALNNGKDPSLGFAVRFFPKGIPADPNPCNDPYASRVSPTNSLRVAGYQGLSCMLAEGEGPPLRLYIFTQQVSSGTLVAQTYVDEPPDEGPGGVPDRVLPLIETLRVQP